MTTLYWDTFEWFASIPFDCPLCKTHIPPNTRHQCSNPKPPEPKVTRAKVTLYDGRTGKGRTLKSAITNANRKPKR